MRAKLAAALGLGLGLALATPGAAADVRLPELGEPADAAMSAREEAEIARNLMRRAAGDASVDRDAQISHYVRRLGRRIASHSTYEPIDGYSFLVIHQGRINAFAAPGGVIAVYTGLMREAENESQLAGVIAHEVAHVSQRHIARSIMAQRENRPSTIAQIIAGVLIGTVNPQAGQAAIISGMARGAQDQLDFSRSAEQEADRIGIRLLSRSGFHPEGMADFFDILMARERVAIDAPPEYMRTHPLSSSRVSDTRGRARELARADQRRDSLTFQLMSKRLRVLDTDEPSRLHERWSGDGPHDDGDRETARQYGLALLEIELDRPGEAAERIAALPGEHRDNLYLLLATAEAEREQGRYDQAEETLRQALDFHPSAWPAVLELGEMLRRRDDPATAAGVLSRFVRMRDDYPPMLWRALARAREEAEQPVASREALAEWHASTYRYDEAIRQIEIGLEQAESGSNTAKRLEARLDQLRNEQRGRLANDPISAD